MRSCVKVYLWLFGIVVMAFPETACLDTAIDRKVFDQAITNLSERLHLQVRIISDSDLQLYVPYENYPFPTTFTFSQEYQSKCVEVISGRIEQSRQKEGPALSKIYISALRDELGKPENGYSVVKPKSSLFSYGSALIFPAIAAYYSHDSPVFPPMAKTIGSITMGVLDCFFLSSLYWGPKVGAKPLMIACGVALPRFISIGVAKQGIEETTRWNRSGYRIIPPGN